MEQIQPGQLAEKLRTPVGAVAFIYTSNDLTNAEVPGGRLLEVVAGDHVFRIQRTDDLLLEFYYASPGAGTRVATLDLKKSPPFSKSRIFMSWSPQDISFALEPDNPGADPLTANGVPSAKNLRVGKDGVVYEIGDQGVQVMELRLTHDGKPILRPSAIDAWNATIQAVTILDSGASSEGYIFEVVVSNLTLSVLVTGFEAYMKTRFVELEREGIGANIEALLNAFYSKREQGPDLLASLNVEAAQNGVSVLEHIVGLRKINFQSYNKAKKAYSKGYGLEFADLKLEQSSLEMLGRLLRIRHRIVHVSPLLSVLNEEDLPAAQPIFPNKVFRSRAVECFKSFIAAMHASTLALRRQ